jgi:hypothetical protein
MDIEDLKQDIEDKELRLSQLRGMDTHKLSAEDRKLIKDLEREINLLKEKLNEE